VTLKIIGPGFGRTGTNSLRLALEQLGFGPCHHMFEVRDNPKLLPDWQAVTDGKPVDWHQVFKGYEAQVDWPGARYWRELLEAFPNAKVILSIRDPNDWFDSVQATIGPFVDARGQHDNDHMNAIAEMCYKMIVCPTFDDRLSDRAYAIRVFEQNIKEVQETVPKDRLLTFDVREGWKPLCAFLNVSLPEGPFPKTNSSKEFVEDVMTSE
jgi:Sulfotransferase domain